MMLPRALRTPTVALALLLVLLGSASAPGQGVPPAPRIGPQLRTVPWRGLRAVSDRAVVRYEPGTTPQQRSALIQDLGARLVRALGPDMAVLDLPAGTGLEAQLSRLNGRPGILHADPDVAIPLVATSVAVPPVAASPASVSDTAAGLQWSLARVRAPEAWAVAQGDAAVVVAVLDTGVLTSHPDLAAHAAWGLDLFAGDDDPTDTHGHGTHCAGLAAAVTDNGLGIAGMGYSCRYAAYRCGDGMTLSSSLIIAALLDAADRGAHVVSMSFGIYLDLPSLETALATARDAGCVLVAAAGNDAQDVPFYPAAYPGVIGVAASAPNDSRAIFSNYGDWVSLAAPGQSMYSTVLGNGYGYMSGTSMACPLVAGMAALLYAHGGGDRSPALADKVRAALEDSAVPVSGAWVSAGRVDLAAAVGAMESGDAPVIQSLVPAAADALGGDVVTVHGTGFLGTTGGLLGSLPVPLTVLDDTTLTFQAPTAPSLGDLPFVVQKGAWSSNSSTFHYAAVSPPRMSVSSAVSVGETLAWQFGSAPGDRWILLASLSPSTAALQGLTLLSPFVIGPVGIADEQGVAGYQAVIPASAAGVMLHTQVISGPGFLAGATAVASTAVAP